MTIGGNDFVMIVPESIPVAEVILRVCRRHWPDAVFQSAGSDGYRSLKDSRIWWEGVSSREFFVFESQELAESWDDSGPTVENCNQLLHFLMRKYGDEPGGVFELTVVYDLMNEWMKTFLRELEDALLDVTSRSPGEEELVAA